MSSEGQLVNVYVIRDLHLHDIIAASVKGLHSTGSFVSLMMCFCEHVCELC
jgi:hypothetical protein